MTATTYRSLLTNTDNMGEIRDLKPVARRLNEKSDGLQATLKKINAALGDLQIGLEVWISDRLTGQLFCLGDRKTARDLTLEGLLSLDDETRLYRHAWELGFCKIDDQWTLAVREVWVHFDQPDPTESYKDEGIDWTGDPRSLLSAARHVRMAATKRISALIDVLKETAEDVMDGIDEAGKIADEL